MIQKILCNKPIKIASKLGPERFIASNVWLDLFKKRQNIFHKPICAGDAGIEFEFVQEWIENTLLFFIQEYSNEVTFNIEETGMFYNIFSHKTFAVNDGNCHGVKLSKLRLTIFLCTNWNGSENITPLIVGKSKKTVCFKCFHNEYDSSKKSDKSNFWKFSLQIVQTNALIEMKDYFVCW